MPVAAILLSKVLSSGLSFSGRGVVVGALMCAVVAATPVVVGPASGHQLRISEIGPGAYEMETTGVDPYVCASVEKVEAGETVLAFEYFCPDGIDGVQVFYKERDQAQWAARNCINAGSLPKAETWQPWSGDLKALSSGRWSEADRFLRLDFGNVAGRKLQIRSLQLRASSEHEKKGTEELESRRQAKLDRARAIDAYLGRSYEEARIDGVAVGTDRIDIRGEIARSVTGTCYLMEFAPEADVWSGQGGVLLGSTPLKSEFAVSVPRFVDGRDRLASRWAVVTMTAGGEPVLLTPAAWADDLSGAAERDMPRLRPANKKGLGGVVYNDELFNHDLKDLGIAAATVNLELSAMFPHRKGTPAIHYSHQGRDWVFNRTAVESWDKTISELTDGGVVVSAIILINKAAGVLVHPDYASSGIFSMVNLTTPEGVDAFRACLSFLAERYSRPDREYGWITHWILFNEVDYGWVWTNMGEQPEAVYMDAYQKALRVAWLEVRRFNPTADVFASFTHHWDYQPVDPMRAYPPRTMLERLARYSAQEGDFEWGVAYHPYPQSLLAPRTWEDSQALPAFNTPYITPKNIEVLDAYLRQPHFLYEGQPRTVLLSEQGFHTPDYSEGALDDKAAAIAYTWEKILPLETVESFHYHRWVDHPDEGGLRVGLRTLPTPGKPFGERKEPAFSVFTMMETPLQEEAAQPWLEHLDISDWQEVRLSPEQIAQGQPKPFYQTE